MTFYFPPPFSHFVVEVPTHFLHIPSLFLLYIISSISKHLEMSSPNNNNPQWQSRINITVKDQVLLPLR